MISKSRGTLILATGLAAFGIFWMVASMLIPIRGISDIAGPRFLPFLAGASLTFVCLLLIVKTLLADRQAGGGLREDDEPDDEAKVQYWRTFGAYASLLLYILLLEHLHFFINTIILSALGLGFSGEPLRPRLLLYALIISVIAYMIFILLLQVPLPGSRYR